jgi:MFS family permease
MLNYMDRQALAVTLPTLKQQFHLAESRVGMIEGCFGYAFAVGSLGFGLLADRWGPRWLYPGVLVGWSLAGIATAGAGQPWVTGWLETDAGFAGHGDLPVAPALPGRARVLRGGSLAVCLADGACDPAPG